MFEVTYTDLQYLTVTFEHPVDEVMVALEINMSDIKAVQCRTFSPTGQELTDLCRDDIVTSIVKK